MRSAVDVDAAVLAGECLGEEREAVDAHGRVVGEPDLFAHLPRDRGLGERRSPVVDGHEHADQHDEHDEQPLHPTSLPPAARPSRRRPYEPPCRPPRPAARSPMPARVDVSWAAAVVRMRPSPGYPASIRVAVPTGSRGCERCVESPAVNRSGCRTGASTSGGKEAPRGTPSADRRSRSRVGAAGSDPAAARGAHGRPRGGRAARRRSARRRAGRRAHATSWPPAVCAGCWAAPAWTSRSSRCSPRAGWSRCPGSGSSTRSCCPAPVPPRWTPACGCCKSRPGGDAGRDGGALVLGELVIDEATYAARLRGRLLELTYKEFELLKYLAQHAGRVFTRAQLLQEVWGYDFFGGTRTVDVHVRRLRAKLGPEHEQMIGTVRNVGYKFVRPSRVRLGQASTVSVVERRRWPRRRRGERRRSRAGCRASPAWRDHRGVSSPTRGSRSGGSVGRRDRAVVACRIDQAEIDEVTALAAAATDGRRHGAAGRARAAAPVPTTPAVHLLARDGHGHGRGFAAPRPAGADDPETGGVAELAVHPQHRRGGVGTRSSTRCWNARPGRHLPRVRPRLRLWAHGELPGAVALAERLGLHPGADARGRCAAACSPRCADPTFPDGVRVRPFVVGADEAEFLRVNNAAFDWHPEQGGWDVAQVKAARGRALVRPGGVPAGRRRGRTGCSASTGRRCTARREHGTRTNRSVRCTCSGVDPAAWGRGSARRSPWPGCATCATAA